MAMIHINRSGHSLGVFDEARVREGLSTGEFIGTDLGWMEGMPAWRPLSEIDTFGVQPPPPIMTTTSAAPAAEPVAVVTPAAATEGTGLPWENREQLGAVNALLATIAMVITRPAEAFRVMKDEGSLLDAVLYVIILGVLGTLASFGFSAVLPGLGFGGDTFGAILGLGASAAFMLFAPVAAVLMIFIIGGIIHLGLMLFGGANRPFETTIRVLCYTGGSANIFLLVPICGSVIATIVTLVLDCIGLASAHRTDTWRPVAALLLPMVVCCGGAMLLSVLIGFGANWN